MSPQFSDQTYNLRIELDTKNCELSAEQIEKLERGLSVLREPVKQFPVAELFLTVGRQPRSQHFRVKAVLGLPNRTLATGDEHEQMHAAFRQCIDKLVHKLTAYKHELENADEISKHEAGTEHEVVARRPIDGEAVREAVGRNDYIEFRKLMFPYEEPVRKRIGRWVQRYPEIDQEIGRSFEIADMVEEVFLNAFQRFDDHPREVPFGDWLEQLIDPSVKLLMDKTDEELENVRFAQSAVEAEHGSKTE